MLSYRHMPHENKPQNKRPTRASSSKLYSPGAVFVYDLDDEDWLRNQEPCPQLVQALSNNVKSLIQAQAFFPFSIKNGQDETGAVAVSTKAHLGESRHVVHVVQSDAVLVVVTGKQKIRLVRSLSEGRRKLCVCVGGGGAWEEGQGENMSELRYSRKESTERRPSLRTKLAAARVPSCMSLLSSYSLRFFWTYSRKLTLSANTPAPTMSLWLSSATILSWSCLNTRMDRAAAASDATTAKLWRGGKGGGSEAARRGRGGAGANGVRTYSFPIKAKTESILASHEEPLECSWRCRASLLLVFSVSTRQNGAVV